jgi:hypothetical protein
MGLRELQLDCGATRAAEGEMALKAASDVVAASVADRVNRTRRKLLEARALCGVTRLFTDDGEMLTHPHLSRARANRGADLHVPMPGKAAKTAARGTLG